MKPLRKVKKMTPCRDNKFKLKLEILENLFNKLQNKYGK
jgi:hypothetical protein